MGQANRHALLRAHTHTHTHTNIHPHTGKQAVLLPAWAAVDADCDQAINGQKMNVALVKWHPHMANTSTHTHSIHRGTATQIQRERQTLTHMTICEFA